MDDRRLSELAAEVIQSVENVLPDHPGGKVYLTNSRFLHSSIVDAFKQIRSEVEEETRRAVAVEACKAQCGLCRQGHDHKNPYGGGLGCNAEHARIHFNLTDADFAPAEETNGTSQAGKSTSDP